MDDLQETPAPKPRPDTERTIVLRNPITDPESKATITELKLREPTADEVDRYLKRAQEQQTEAAGFVLLTSLVAGISEAAARLLGMWDVNKAIAFFVPIITYSPAPAAPPAPGGAPVEPEYERTITLRKAVAPGRHDPATSALAFTELALREPTLALFEQISKKQKTTRGLELTIFMIAAVAKVPAEAVRNIGMLDVKEAESFLIPFLDSEAAFPTTGGR